MPKNFLVLFELKLELCALPLNFFVLFINQVKLVEQLFVVLAQFRLAPEHIAESMIDLLLVFLHLFLVFWDHIL